SKRLVPTVAKSYQMFFQMVTHSLCSCCTIVIGEFAFAPLPCYYGLSAGAPANVADLGWGY
ncbi:MAG: hypothetical protein ABI970_10540, partial [Chloroflexota bacterium]